MIEEDFENLVYRFAHKWSGLDEWDDLVQEGWEALLRAKQKHNENRTKFITYAYCSIDNQYKDLYAKRQAKRHLVRVDYEEGDIFNVIGKNTIEEVEDKIWLKQFLSSLSEDARKICEYIIEDTEIEKCMDIKKMVKYWNKLEEKFQVDILTVKHEIELALLKAI